MNILICLVLGFSTAANAQNPTTPAVDTKSPTPGAPIPPIPSATIPQPSGTGQSTGAAPVLPMPPPPSTRINKEAPVELDGPPVTPENLEKAQKLCRLTEKCNKAHPGRAAICLKTSLKDSGLIPHVLEGGQAKDLSRFLRRDGFIDMEMGLRDFSTLPEGAILVLDAHDPLKDKRPLCPKVYGNVVVKCGDKWIDDQKYDLDFHMKRRCRTKGIWVLPALIPPKPKAKIPTGH